MKDEQPLVNFAICTEQLAAQKAAILRIIEGMVVTHEWNEKDPDNKRLSDLQRLLEEISIIR